MPTAPYYQHESVRHMFYADAAIKNGDFRDAAIRLTCAASCAATAANLHWHLFRSLTQRKLANVLLTLAGNDLITASCAATFRQLYDLPHRVTRDLQAGNRPAARRAVRTSYRRTAHLVRSVNLAIAAHPNPDWLIFPDYVQQSKTSSFHAPSTRRSKSPARQT